MAGDAWRFTGWTAVWRCSHGRRKLLTTYFPEVVAAVVEQLPSGTVLDGELVVYRGGRCDFMALQQRIHSRHSSATEATLVVSTC